jgi:hypothetical protein
VAICCPFLVPRWVTTGDAGPHYLPVERKI